MAATVRKRKPVPIAVSIIMDGALGASRYGDYRDWPFFTMAGAIEGEPATVWRCHTQRQSTMSGIQDPQMNKRNADTVGDHWNEKAFITLLSDAIEHAYLATSIP